MRNVRDVGETFPGMAAVRRLLLEGTNLGCQSSLVPRVEAVGLRVRVLLMSFHMDACLGASGFGGMILEPGPTLTRCGEWRASPSVPL